MTLLRYPGGKSRGFLHQRIIDLIVCNFQGGTFVEPFFGGGAITIALLENGIIDSLVIAEKDISLQELWYTVAQNPSYLIKKVKKFQPSVEAFERSKKRVQNGTGGAFDALIVNRLAHGGRGVMAGPQGGNNQQGKYKIGCRWNANKLVRTINHLHDLFSRVDIDFYDDYLDCEGDFYYIDPPYWDIKKFYLHGFDTKDHFQLANWVFNLNTQWLLSYNNHSNVSELYKDYEQEILSATGNGGSKLNSELLIYNFY